MSYVLGIDLGTTYTAAAIAADGQAEIFQLGDRAASIPSAVVLKDDGTLLVGDAAARRAPSEPRRAASEFKRRLGDPVPVLLGGTPFSVETLSAHVLRAVLAAVTARRGEPPAAVAITHPASYSAYRLELLAEACRQAGLRDPIFCSEPAAAAVHYSSQERVNPGETIAVYDLGGGTFDIAILQKVENGFELIGRPDGIDRLGGVDFDQAIFAHVAGTVELNLGPLSETDAGRTALWRLREECREAKEALSADTEAVIPVILPGVQTEVRITRAEFESMIRPRIAETVEAMRRAAASAGRVLGEIDRVLLVGGSSRIPLVGQAVASATGSRVMVDAHPKHAIALGAAMLASQSVPAIQTETAKPPSPPVSTPTRPVKVAENGPARRVRTSIVMVGAVIVAAALGAAAVFGLVGGSDDGEPPIAPEPTATLAASSTVPGAAPSPSESALLTPSPTPAPFATINAIEIEDGRYVVQFATTSVELQGTDNVVHVHFFWDSVPVTDAGVPGAGPWFVYGGLSPFTGYSVAERPPAASQLCILVANPDHSVRPGTGNCVRLP